MSLSKQRRGQIGVNTVERIVIANWGDRWQPIDSYNDDGIDGLIFLENGGELSGQVIFVQVKCIKARQRTDGKYAISISKNRLARNLNLWRKVVGAAIVVLVDPESLIARWVDIKPSHWTTPSQIFVPHEQIFDKTARRSISTLCGTLHQDLQAKKVHTFASDFLHVRSAEHIQPASRKIYISLEQTPTHLGGNGDRIHFDREGWRHITRPKRSQLSKYQSFVLLGAVRKIIEQCKVPLNHLPNNYSKDHGCQFFWIDSMVTFPFRQTGLVRLILKNSMNGTERPELTFWTIYEPRRKHSGLGTQEPRAPINPKAT